MDGEERIRFTVEHTEVLRAPRQSLATFGSTNVRYFLLTEPVYAELVGETSETVVREGRVIAERPRIVTPLYLSNLFEGFEHGKEYVRFLAQNYGPYEPGLLYKYKNEPKEVSIVSETIGTVAARLSQIIDREEDPLAAIIKGVDEMWDVSLMKFIHDLTSFSLRSNIVEMGARGLFEMDRPGVPRDARNTIEEFFERVKRGEADPSELKAELDRWGLFAEYEDRFLGLFRRRWAG